MKSNDPTVNSPTKRPKMVATEMINNNTPINLPMTIKNVVNILPIVSIKS